MTTLIYQLQKYNLQITNINKKKQKLKNGKFNQIIQNQRYQQFKQYKINNQKIMRLKFYFQCLIQIINNTKQMNWKKLIKIQKFLIIFTIYNLFKASKHSKNLIFLNLKPIFLIIPMKNKKTKRTDLFLFFKKVNQNLTHNILINQSIKRSKKKICNKYKIYKQIKKKLKAYKINTKIQYKLQTSIKKLLIYQIQKTQKKIKKISYSKKQQIINKIN
ncbi:hypothetical protein IMG5_001140 [Ichthyophthirius multifiliis]|uniref:Uncharacterized protein n=1 Tax=Ichthyophthirius multifiliis TaxID=5932 RepID=G0QIQ5_ICHMU|nr:hypothetical protein IMG5_001140 [Ichthyophthirius multifiliis]EGR34885.1 hypothetical protein IMG5_001140 [Ichthyophthirius multifiliis]|eukprot:XP_004040189.1 hypothetical protein IMG5_001140 [Ichthyophthirius multifiliis]